MPHRCKLCPYAGSRKELLEYHMAIHARDGFVKKHICYMCDKMFTHYKTHLDHMKTVHGTRKGPSIYDVRTILGTFDPLPPLSLFGTDLQY